MYFSTQREPFLRALTQVVNVVERRQTAPVLANLLVQVQDGSLTLTGTDTEVEMCSRIRLDKFEKGETTIPARKLFEIVRSLPDAIDISLSQKDDKVTLQAGRSRFTLASLPVAEFPVANTLQGGQRVQIPEDQLKELFERTAFAMAQQDVRFYLNGLLIDVVGDGTLSCVATDGHRLATFQVSLGTMSEEKRQLIVPRKGVMELQRLLENVDASVELEIAPTHIRVNKGEVTFTSKLIDGRFPDYHSVIPIGLDLQVLVHRENFKTALQRVAILTNEKYRGVRLDIEKNQIIITAHNPNQEEAHEEIEAQSNIHSLTISFNVNYLLDALHALRGEEVMLQLRDAQSSMLLREGETASAQHVIMPLHL